SATIVNGNAGNRKRRVGKCADRHAHRAGFTVFGMKYGRPTDRTKPEDELRSLIADAQVLGRGPEDSERRGESREGSEDTAGPSLAREAMANAHAPWFSLDLDAQLPAGTRGSSRRHQSPCLDRSSCRDQPYLTLRNGIGAPA